PDKIPPFSDPAKHRMEEGTRVGEFATKLYAKGIHIPTKDFKENLTKTKDLLKKRKPLFEPGFKYTTPNGDIFARVDILLPVGKDKWDIIEVKSRTSVKDLNLHDVAFQKYLLEKCGLKIRKYFLCHVNSEFVKNGEIKPKDFFIVEDVCEGVDELYGGVEGNIKGFFEIIALKKCPKVTKEDILNSEYSNVAVDEFYDSLPEENVFELCGIRKQKALELYEKGIIKIKDIPPNVKLTSKQVIQKKCSLNGKNHEECDEIRNFLNKLEHPLYYLDFETFSTVIPLFDKTKPYQAVPFQFSLHIVKKKDDKPKHISFLADGRTDPRNTFLQALKDNLGGKGSIVVYNEGFEKGRIKECIESFPEFEKWGQKILERIMDLLHPFKKFHFYHPKQKGGAGLKKVLPIFSKDVKYDDLVISNGLDASVSYYKSHFEDVPAGEKAKIREALEKYCELDTYAEIVLVEELEKLLI
ncbi:MAG: DUF2779 domain-containing protein, partial [Nanoarchaeota archaeon]|nr:DUF2779 domain-containing protein [Nanoarchaeota archaeon]